MLEDISCSENVFPRRACIGKALLMKSTPKSFVVHNLMPSDVYQSVSAKYFCRVSMSVQNDDMCCSSAASPKPKQRLVSFKPYTNSEFV